MRMRSRQSPVRGNAVNIYAGVLIGGGQAQIIDFFCKLKNMWIWLEIFQNDIKSCVRRIMRTVLTLWYQMRTRVRSFGCSERSFLPFQNIFNPIWKKLPAFNKGNQLPQWATNGMSNGRNRSTHMILCFRCLHCPPQTPWPHHLEVGLRLTPMAWSLTGSSLTGWIQKRRGSRIQSMNMFGHSRSSLSENVNWTLVVSCKKGSTTRWRLTKMTPNSGGGTASMYARQWCWRETIRWQSSEPNSEVSWLDHHHRVGFVLWPLLTMGCCYCSNGNGRASGNQEH